MNSGHELATVIKNFLPLYDVDKQLPYYKYRVLDALQKCRTSYMGGHIEACECCGKIRVAFNSCRNRHCPKCGGIEKEKWIIAREADLLPVKYFHLVFTVPDKLNSLFLNNQIIMYNLLFRTAWSVISNFGNDKKWLGGRIGATAILHTWGQNLQYHPHIHFVVPAGALMANNKWKNSRSRGKYLFDVECLSSVFRARLVANIRQSIITSEIKGNIPMGLFRKKWVVFAKRPFCGPEKVIEYLGRYTHRTAISNERILKVTDQHVTFRWKDYRNNNKIQITTMQGKDFLQLFCLHILPPGFTRIRHYGYLSSAAKVKSLAIIRKCLKVRSLPQQSKNKSWHEIAMQRMGLKPGICNECGGNMVIVESMPNHFRQRAPPNMEM
jgi:hypothetical protein